jgi:hypothetical protein
MTWQTTTASKQDEEQHIHSKIASQQTAHNNIKAG